MSYFRAILVREGRHSPSAPSNTLSPYFLTCSCLEDGLTAFCSLDALLRCSNAPARSPQKKRPARRVPQAIRAHLPTGG